MNNPIDKAHALAKAIKGSDEFQEFKSAAKEVKANEGSNKMVLDFEKKQFELQKKKLAGEDVQKETEKLQELYSLLMQDPVAAKYVQKQMNFAIMMEDISKILAESTDIQ